MMVSARVLAGPTSGTVLYTREKGEISAKIIVDYKIPSSRQGNELKTYFWRTAPHTIW